MAGCLQSQSMPRGRGRQAAAGRVAEVGRLGSTAYTRSLTRDGVTCLPGHQRRQRSKRQEGMGACSGRSTQQRRRIDSSMGIAWALPRMVLLYLQQNCKWAVHVIRTQFNKQGVIARLPPDLQVHAAGPRLAGCLERAVICVQCSQYETTALAGCCKKRRILHSTIHTQTTALIVHPRQRHVQIPC